MCGIVGFNWPDEQKIQELTNSIAHRGPDQTGIYINEQISFGHRRLSILDLSAAGHQPAFYEATKGAYSKKYQPDFLINSDLGIVFNGEIYNFQEIRATLIKKGFTFTTRCDTEVILASYLAWGKKCVEKFNGMWAFCIYDKKKNQLFLSRDRLGIKPLYYYHYQNKFAFGSELKTILQSGIPKAINPTALNHYLLLGFAPPEQSMVQGVAKLLPAHNLTFDLTKNKIIEVKRYWQTTFSQTIKDEKTAIQAIREALDKAVKRRLLADVPVGAFLSGGVDSSVIVYLMRKYVKDLKTFSIRFDYNDFNESKWAKIISDKFETDHHEITFTSKEVVDYIPKLPFHFDEPFGDASMIPTFLVSKVAREKVTVCLSGTGGDELFAGYHRHHEFLMLQKLVRFPSVFKKLLSTGYSVVNKDKAKKLNELLQSSSNSELYIKLFSHLFRGKQELVVDLEKVAYIRTYFRDTHTLTKLLNFEQNLYLPEDLLVKEDRATMANSLEGRVPFLDHELVNVANQIDNSLKLKGKEGKYILKKAFEDFLPHEILYRKKQGFGVPLKYYFQKELKDFAYSQLFDYKGYDYYDKKTINHLWQNHQNNTSDYSALFWNLMMFNMWYKQWI